MSDGHVHDPESGANSSGHTPESGRSSTGAWVGYVIFALFLLFLLTLDAQAITQHEWATFTGITVFTLAFVIFPTGAAAKWLRRSARGRKLLNRRG